MLYSIFVFVSAECDLLNDRSDSEIQYRNCIRIYIYAVTKKMKLFSNHNNKLSKQWSPRTEKNPYSAHYWIKHLSYIYVFRRLIQYKFYNLYRLIVMELSHYLHKHRKSHFSRIWYDWISVQWIWSAIIHGTADPEITFAGHTYLSLPGYCRYVRYCLHSSLFILLTSLWLNLAVSCCQRQSHINPPLSILISILKV